MKKLLAFVALGLVVWWIAPTLRVEDEIQADSATEAELEIIALPEEAALVEPWLSNISTFTPMDTSHLTGSPDPLPLESVRAFPKLRFNRPVEFTHAGDGTNLVYVVELPGVIRLFENHDGASEASVFLDIRDIVQSTGYEEGLVGLAFHPRYRENGEFFVFYTAAPTQSVVSRFRVSEDNPRVADRASEEVILRTNRHSHDHVGGSIRFGHDGYLYIALGDGGSLDDCQGHGQSLKSLLAGVLRIDVDHHQPPLAYAIPEDNPYVNTKGARGEIWAKGLRNPWRLSVDAATGELWTGDVGQHRFEEVNRVRRGGNYGWNIREGFESYQPSVQSKPERLIDPIVAYDRGRGESITGGAVYRGRQLTQFVGHYIYGDYVSGDVWALRMDGERLAENRHVASVGQYITAFGQDAEGELYLCTYDGWLFRLRERSGHLETVAQEFPRKLSETGLYLSVEHNEPAPAMIPYEVNMPFWSDYAVKDRYLVLPEEASVGFDETGKWQMPVGTVLCKTIWMHRDRDTKTEPFRLETRLLVHSPDGWQAYTYVYNDDQTDAELLDGSRNESIELTSGGRTIHQPYYFPARHDCFTCHTRGEGFVLGMTTRQLNRVMHYQGESENQLAMFDRLGIFTQPLEKTPDQLERFPEWGYGNLVRSQAPDAPRAEESMQGDLGDLARAWLDVHCAVCHRPRGVAPHYRDLRYHTPLEKTNLIGGTPNHGHLTLRDSHIVTPGRPGESELLYRMGQRGPRQMPPLATHVPDPKAVAVIRDWIRRMPEEEPVAP